MKTISASVAKQTFAQLIDSAAVEPVVVRRQKRDVAVVLSIADYQRLVGLNVAEFQRHCDKVGAAAKKAGLTQAKLNRLLAS